MSETLESRIEDMKVEIERIEPNHGDIFLVRLPIPISEQQYQSICLRLESFKNQYFEVIGKKIFFLTYRGDGLEISKI